MASYKSKYSGEEVDLRLSFISSLRNNFYDEKGKLKEFNEELIPDTIARKTDILQPDYNQNDETASDYIKNRPFYKGDGENSLRTEDATALSDDSIAMGNNSVVGVKGYYCYKHIPTDAETGNRILIISDKQYTANDDNHQDKDIVDTSKIEVGDKISIGDSRKVYLNCSTIVNVDSSYIMVDTVPFEQFSDVDANDIEQTDRFIFIVDKPDVGHSVVGTHAIALGLDNKAIGFGSFSCGAGNISAGSLSYTEGHANYAGFIAHAEGLKTKANSYSHAEGLYTEASGIGSHVEGEFAIASGSYSHAEGQRSESIGNVAHSEGYETKAEGSVSHTEGLITHAVGEGSHAEGKATKANAKYSHAEGLSTQANGEQSHAEGNGTIAKGNHSHAEGYQTQANSGDAHAEGAYTKANGGNSHAEGHTTTAKGTNSHAEGSSTVAEGASSHAEGNNTKALADYSHAEGNDTTASGVHSHAEGINTVASGRHSHAEGYKTKATAGDAHSEGAYTEAKGENSHAEGYNTIATGKDSHVQGRYNIEDTENKYAHILGNGTSGSPSNAHTVDWDGNAWFEGEVSVGSKHEKLVTENIVDAKLASLVNSAPETLDTLNELSKALGDDANFAATVSNNIGELSKKVEEVKNTQSDYNQNDETSSDYIKNRPFYEENGEIKQLDEKFIPDTIARTNDIMVDEWKHLGTSTNDSGDSILEFPLPLEAGDTIRITAYANPDSGLDTEFDETHVFDGIPFYACGDRCYVESTWLGGAPIYTFTVYKQVSVPIKDKMPEFATKADVEEAKYTYVTDKKLGEAVPMIGDTTTFIGLDEELNTGDMIMVKGYFNDGTSESYVVEVGEIGGDYGGRIDADVGRLDNVHVPISTSVTFQSEIKGEVYRVNKVLISDAVTEIDTALNNIIEKYGLGGDA